MMPSIRSNARRVAKGIIREFWPSPERAMLQLLEQESARRPRYSHGEVETGPYRIEYADAMSVWPQWEDIFIRDALAFDTPVSAPRIIDCGANVGIASMYFKYKYPAARVTAFEADPQLAAICDRNCARLPGPEVTVLASAAWITDGQIEFIREGSDSGAIASLEPTVAGEKTVIAASRLRNWLEEPVDLLKIDIEGAELPVLEDCADRLHNVRNITLDLHEFDPGRRQTGAVFDLFTKAGFVFDITHLTPLPWRAPRVPSPFHDPAPVWAVMVRAWRR